MSDDTTDTSTDDTADTSTDDTADTSTGDTADTSTDEPTGAADEAAGGGARVTKMHHLKPAPGSKQRKKRVARGDRGRGGKTAGRGTKGTGARGKVPIWFEGGQMPLIRRQPKRPGFTPPSSVEYTVINVNRLDREFEDGDEITSETLTERGLVKSGRPVKVLGHGDLATRLTVVVDAVSDSAREKIEGAGGSVTTS